VELEKSRTESVMSGGVEDWLIMKTTESGFSNFVADEFRTLPDTEDRVLATQAKVTWKYSGIPENYVALREQMLSVMLEEFASRFSPSVQTTLFQMAEAALGAIPEVSEVTLAMPNKHYLLINLQPFSMENKNEVFLPTDEPHGQIEATVKRKG
jgi:urate oxidase